MSLAKPRVKIAAIALLALALLGILALVLRSSNSATDEPTIVGPNYTVVNTFPHDPDAFTQGLEFVEGNLVESTGLNGESSLRIVEPETGEVISQVNLDQELFGEGVTAIDDSLFQLTWKAERVLAYEIVQEAIVETSQDFRYIGEGWGLCWDGNRFIKSNGSDTLIFHSGADFSRIGQVTVTEDGEAVTRLNELECVGDTILANVFESTEIKVIDLATGEVSDTIDVQALVPAEVGDDAQNVANGIAIDPATGNLWVTGKRWASMFELDISAVESLN